MSTDVDIHGAVYKVRTLKGSVSLQDDKQENPMSRRVEILEGDARVRGRARGGESDRQGSLLIACFWAGTG
jgi:hypothetical protein